MLYGPLLAIENRQAFFLPRKCGAALRHLVEEKEIFPGSGPPRLFHRREILCVR